MADTRDKPGQPPSPKAPDASGPFIASDDEWESDLDAWDHAMPIAPEAISGSTKVAPETSGDSGAVPKAENPFALTPITAVSAADPRAAMREGDKASIGEEGAPRPSFDDGEVAPGSGSYVAISTEVAPAPSPPLAATAPVPTLSATVETPIPSLRAPVAPAASPPSGPAPSPPARPAQPAARSPAARSPSPVTSPPPGADTGPPARRQRPSRPWPILPSATDRTPSSGHLTGARPSASAPARGPVSGPGAPASGTTARGPAAKPPLPGASDGPTRVVRLPMPETARKTAPNAVLGIPSGTLEEGRSYEDDSYAAIVTDEVGPPTIFDLEPPAEEAVVFPEVSLREMAPAFWQTDSPTPAVAVGGESGPGRPEPGYWIALQQLLADEQAAEGEATRKVDLALGAARVAELAGDLPRARAHVETALSLDVPDSTASASRPGWSAVHRARLILAERAGALATEDGSGAESLARLALWPHPDQGAYRELQAELTLVRSAGGVSEPAAAARITATPVGLARILAEAELAWRDPGAAAAILAAAGNARPGPLGAALLALAGARSELARDFQAAAEQRYDAATLEENRRLVRMGLVRDAARLDPEAAAVALAGLLPTFEPSPLKVSLGRWMARVLTRLGRHDAAWVCLIEPDALGPMTAALARDRVDLRGRARGTSVGAAGAAELLASVTGPSPRLAARALAALNACAWATDAEVMAVALDRVDDLVSSGSDAVLVVGRALEELASRATDPATRRRAIETWQRADAARWLPAAFERAAVAETATQRETVWREIARRHPESPVFLRLAAAAAQAGRIDEAAAVLVEGASAWTGTPLAAPLLELGAEQLSAVDLPGACARLETLAADEETGGVVRHALGRALRRLGDRARFMTFARRESHEIEGSSRAHRAALLLEPSFWPTMAGESPAAIPLEEEGIDEAFELVPFHPVALGLALSARPDSARMALRWLGDARDAGRAGSRAIHAAVWRALGGDADQGLALMVGLLGRSEPVVAMTSSGMGFGSPASLALSHAARNLARRLAWSESDPQARGELFVRLAGGAGVPADRLFEAAEQRGRAGDRAGAEELLGAALIATGADALARDLAVGLDPLASPVLAPSGSGPVVDDGPEADAGLAAGGDPLSRLRDAVQGGRHADVVSQLLEAPPQGGTCDAATLALALEIDDGRESGRRATELMSHRAFAAGHGALGYWAFATPKANAGILETVAGVATGLGDARSAALLLVEAALRFDGTPDSPLPERLLRAAVAADPRSAPAASAWRRWLVRAMRLGEGADAAAAEAEALVDPALRVQALVRAAALSVMVAPAEPIEATAELTASRGRAAALLRRALEIAPADGDVFAKLRDVYELLEDHAALAKLLAHRIGHTSNPFEMTALHLARADLLAEPLGDRAAAKAELGAILAKEPQHGRALGRLADLEEEDGNDAAAAELLVQRAAGERVPERLRELFLRLGRIHTQKLPDPKRAVAAYARVLQLDANNREALDALSLLYVGLGETKSATAITERLVRIETAPDRRAAYHVRLGQLAERAGDARVTVQQFRRAVEAAPRDLEALGELVRFLDKTHDLGGRRHVLDAAALDMRVALLAKPTDATLRDGFAAVQRWRGRPASASAAVELGLLLSGVRGADADAAVAAAARGDASTTTSSSSSRSAGRRRLAAIVTPAVDDRMYPPTVPSPVRHLFRLIVPLERPNMRPDLARFGIERSHRIPEGRGPRELMDGIAADLGVTAYELYVTPPATLILRVLPARPAVIVLSKGLVEIGADAIRFAAGRALRLCSSNLDLAIAGEERELAAWLLGVIRQFVPTYRRDDVPTEMANAATARMARLIPKKQRQELLPVALEASGALDVSALMLGIRDGANRAGLLAAARLDVALRVVLGLDAVEPTPETLRTNAEARALVEFALSDEHDEIVRSLA